MRHHPRHLRNDLGGAADAARLHGASLGIAYPLVDHRRSRRSPGCSTRPTARSSRSTARSVGSTLIGQSFTDDKGNPLPQYFQSRPSAAGAGYDPTETSARRNLGPEIDRRHAADPAVKGDTGKPEPAHPGLLAQPRRRQARRRRRLAGRTAPPDGVGAVLAVFYVRARTTTGRSPVWSRQPGLPGDSVHRHLPGRPGAAAPSSARTTRTGRSSRSAATPRRTRPYRPTPSPPVGLAARPARSAPPTRICRNRASPRPAASASPRSHALVASTRPGVTSGSWASPRSTCCNSTSRWTAVPVPQPMMPPVGARDVGASGANAGAAARLSRCRARRRQDLHDARRGPPAPGRGTDVVVGFVETHGRPHTAASSRASKSCPARR